MKCKVPCCIPGIFPLIRHGDDFAVQHVEPLGISHVVMSLLGQWMGLVFIQPLVKIEVIVLLAPKHPGQRLPVNTAFVVTQRPRRDPFIEFVGFGQPSCKYLFEVRKGVCRSFSP